MGPDHVAASAAPVGSVVSWRDLAVARVLDPARSRAETRLQRFFDAALELLSSSPGKEFTVQEVVERSGQSLRSFYQYFDGKHELLLGLFEDAVRLTAAHLLSVVEREDDPLARLHCFVVEYHRLCRPSLAGPSPVGGLPPVLADFAQQLLTQQPEQAARAFLPLTSRLNDLLTQAAAAGVVRAGLRPGASGVILQAIMFHAFARTISASLADSEPAHGSEELWDLFLHGLAVDPRAAHPKHDVVVSTEEATA